MIQIATETFGSVLVAHTPDELTEETAPALRETVRSAAESGSVHVVLSMDRSEVFDGPGLSALLDLQDELRARGGGLRICGLGDPGARIFEVTRLDRKFDHYETLAEAVSSFR